MHVSVKLDSLVPTAAIALPARLAPTNRCGVQAHAICLVQTTPDPLLAAIISQTVFVTLDIRGGQMERPATPANQENTRTPWARPIANHAQTIPFLLAAAQMSRRASATLAFLKRTEETAPCAMPANTRLTLAMPTVLRVPVTHNLWPGAPQSPTAAAIMVTPCRTILPIMRWHAPPASLASTRTRLAPRTVPNACATHTILIMRA